MHLVIGHAGVFVHDFGEIEQVSWRRNDAAKLVIPGLRNSLRDVEISRGRNEFDARAKVAKGANGPRHMHRRGYEQDAFEALFAEYRTEIPGMLAGVFGLRFGNDRIFSHTEAFEELGHIFRGRASGNSTRGDIACADDSWRLALTEEISPVKDAISGIGDLDGLPRWRFSQNAAAEDENAVGLRDWVGGEVFPFEVLRHSPDQPAIATDQENGDREPKADAARELALAKHRSRQQRYEAERGWVKELQEDGVEETQIG